MPVTAVTDITLPPVNAEDMIIYFINNSVMEEIDVVTAQYEMVTLENIVPNTTSGPGHHHLAVLEQNCRESWPTWTCIFANICGLTSTTVWFIVLLPQVWKNFRRKSVAGLSVLWATANFTASLVNIFFVFMYVSVPLYSEISSVYLPVLEFTLLIQFWVYGADYRWSYRILYLSLCLLMWSTVIVLQVVSRGGWLEWFAIVLWCVETFPQILLNMRLQSTSGQATSSVVIAMFGKTTDILSTYILDMPLQYVVMAYFSSSVAYINGIQVCWYYKNNDENSRHSDDGATAESAPVSAATSQSSVYGSRSMNSTVDLVPTIHVEQNNTTCVDVIRILGAGLLCLFLAVCIAGLIWQIGPLYGSLGPTSIFLVLSVAYLWFRKRFVIQNSIQRCLFHSGSD